MCGAADLLCSDLLGLQPLSLSGGFHVPSPPWNRLPSGCAVNCKAAHACSRRQSLLLRGGQAEGRQARKGWHLLGLGLQLRAEDAPWSRAVAADGGCGKAQPPAAHPRACSTPCMADSPGGRRAACMTHMPSCHCRVLLFMVQIVPHRSVQSIDRVLPVNCASCSVSSHWMGRHGGRAAPNTNVGRRGRKEAALSAASECIN